MYYYYFISTIIHLLTNVKTRPLEPQRDLSTQAYDNL